MFEHGGEFFGRYLGRRLIWIVERRLGRIRGGGCVQRLCGKRIFLGRFFVFFQVMAEGYTSKNESKEEHDDKLNSFSAGSVFGGLGGSCHGRELSCDEMFVGGSEVDVKCVSILPTPSGRGGSCVRGSEVQEKAVMNENLRDICEGQSRTGWGNVEKK